MDEAKKNKEVIVELVQDEMAIKKIIEFRDGKFIGCADLGMGDCLDDSTPAASEALVVMAVAVNSGWKIPLGYFLINSLTGEERSRIVDMCANKLRSIGIHVLGLTCDAPAANLSMMTHLGARIDPFDPKTDFFPSSFPDEPISLIWDACHMLKLVRNTLGDLQILKNKEGAEIKWEYFELLEKFQKSEGLHAANKIRQAHIQWEKQKMKVSLAAQTLSNSVADALRFCRTELALPDFQGSEATEDFIRVFNDLFDVMNSRNVFGRNLKAPMTLINENQWSSVFEKASTYIKGLSLPDGTKVVHSRRKTGFLGFLHNLHSLRKMFNDYVRTGRLKYLLTYKLSQDHLELFFGCIRSRLGCNNNPTASQFKSSYKRLLIHGVMHGLHGNCLPQDDTDILTYNINEESSSTKKSLGVPSTIDKDVEKVRRKYNLQDHIWDHDYVTSLLSTTNLSNFQESVVEYIGGFVVRQILKSSKCETCCSEVSRTSSDQVFKLVNLKDKGGLIRISQDVKKVCETTELSIQRILKCTTGSVPLSAHLLPAIATTVLEIISEKYT